MTFRQAAVCLGALAFLVGFRAQAVAQEEDAPTESVVSENAGELFARGQRAFDDRDFVSALELFQRAQTLQPHDAVLYNAALSLERLGRYVESVAIYESLAESTELDGPTRQDAAERLTAADARVATLQVSGWIGARLWVDGESRCVIPCSARVDPGPRALRAELDGGEWSDTVEVRASESRSIRVTPRASPAQSPLVDTGEGEQAQVPVAEPAIGWLGIVGASTAVIGGAGILGFGLRTNALERDYQGSTLPNGHPELNTLEDNTRRMSGLANASIGVAAVGVVLLAIDLILRAAR